MPLPALLGLEASEWSAIGTLMLGLSAAIGGVWAVLLYQRERRIEAARWVHDTIYRDFNLEDRFSVARQALVDDEMMRGYQRSLERRILDRHVERSPDELAWQRDLDRLLNFFEHVLYLERQGSIRRADAETVVGYFLRRVADAPINASLRRYLVALRFRGLIADLELSVDEYIALTPEAAHVLSTEEPPIPDELWQYAGECELAAKSHRAALYLVSDREVFGRLDALFGFRPDDLVGCRWQRGVVALAAPELDAWCYTESVDQDLKGRRRAS